MDKFLAVFETFFQESEVVLARLDELGGFLQLGQAAGGLHVGDLEVVAQVAVGVFVVVTVGQVPQLLAKTFAAGVVLAGLAITVPAPVTKALGDGFEIVVVGEHRTTFAHGDVVRRVKAQGADVAKGADHLATVGGAQRIAAVFDQPQVVLLAQGSDHVQAERVAQAVRQHDGLGLRCDGRFDLGRIDVVGEPVHIDKHRYRTKLQDRVDGGGKACRHTNDFVTFLNGARA